MEGSLPTRITELQMSPQSVQTDPNV